MIETFTRKMPTDEMFTGETSLKKWVEESLRVAVTEVVDAELLSSEEEEGAKYAAKTKCISSIMSLALKCATDIPEERMKVKDALVDLQKIRTNFLMDVQEF